MFTCQYIVAIVGVTDGSNDNAVKAMIAFICIYIFFFATTWGPGAWVLIGEIYPLPIRSRGVALSTASNWLWNCVRPPPFNLTCQLLTVRQIIAIMTPYITSTSGGGVDLGPKIFFLWGSLCVLCFLYAYFLIPETKGLTLEQVDRMMEETTPRNSAKWIPHSSYAQEMGYQKREEGHSEKVEQV